MSATGRGGHRDRLDRYYTPMILAGALVDLIDLSDVSTVLEPSVGAGAFAQAIWERRPGIEITGADIDPGAPGFDYCDRARVQDFLTWKTGDQRWDLVVGNPPYRHAQQHIEKALTLAPRVAFLLRLAFLESQRRAAFWRRWPAARIWVLSERPSFTQGGTDSTAYAFFLWDRARPGPMRLDVLSWRR